MKGREEEGKCTQERLDIRVRKNERERNVGGRRQARCRKKK